jgi:hypothetical protein
MSNKQYTFSLPPEAGEIIDSLPKMEKSERVAQALLHFERQQAKQKTLDVLALLKPREWETDKDAVTLVEEARAYRSANLSDNRQEPHE